MLNFTLRLEKFSRRLELYPRTPDSITAGLPTGHKKTFFSSVPPLYTLFLHPFSRSLFYPISICDSPYFKTPSALYTPSLHSFTIHTPSISSSLPSTSTPFSTTSTAQSPLGSPLVTWQPPYMTNPPLPLPFYSSSLPDLSTPFLHPFTTPLLYPISIHLTVPLYTLHLSSSLLSHSTTLPSASTPFSTISTAQLPLGSPLVTNPLYD